MNSEISNLNIESHLQSMKITDESIKSVCRELLSAKYPTKHWSQAFQDWFIYHNFFKNQKNGIYLDIGAHKPLSLSNTAIFDICLGWKGLCIEPSRTFLEFKDIRSCTMVNRCAWNESDLQLNMQFNGDGSFSLVIGHDEKMRIEKELPEKTSDLFECRTLSAFHMLNNFTLRNKFDQSASLAINAMKKITIDFISMDIEGSEVQFLKCFPFANYDVKVWLIEINKNSFAIDEVMIAHNYIKYEMLSLFHYPLDAIYIKNTIKEKVYPWENLEFKAWKKSYSECKH